MGKNLMVHVERLAREIGPRGSGSEGERRAAGYVEEVLRGLGWRAERQEFSSVTSFSWGVMIIFGLSVAGAALCRSSPPAAVLLAFLGAIALVLESSTVSTVTRVLPRRPCLNIVAHAATRSGPDGESRRRVVVVAHGDSSRAAVLFHPAIVRFFRLIFLLAVASVFAVAVGTVVGLVVPRARDAVSAILVAPTAYLVILFGILVHRELFCVVSPGANDNGSGVAVLLGLAEEFALTPPPGVDLWFLATGGEEAGTTGMLRFLEARGKEFKEALFLNLDNCGAGEPKYVVGEGMLRVYRCDAELLRAARRVAEERRELGFGPCVYQSLTTDGLAALVRGYRAMSLMAFAPDGTLPDWHWVTDTPERVDPDNLARTLRFASEMIRELASRGRSAAF